MTTQQSSERSSTRSSTRENQQMTAQPPAQASAQAADQGSDQGSEHPQLEYEDVIDILTTAATEIQSMYSDRPPICEELMAQIADGIGECEARKREPITLLRARLLGEWHVFNAWNKHRMNNPEQLTEACDNIDEEMEAFPIRLETLSRGYTALAEELPPIHQSTDGENDDAEDYAAPSSTKKSGKSVENYDKLLDAPPTNIAFPNANMVITEIAAFLPNCFKSDELVDRLVANGLTQSMAVAMINHYRTMGRGQIPANTVLRMWQAAFRKRAKDEVDEARKLYWSTWKPSLHKTNYHDASNFDPASISVSGYRAAVDGKDTSVHGPVPFTDLGKDVKEFPSGDDALDLTRMVEYCMAHQEETWMYPTDYDKLLNHIGGPARILPGMIDAAVVNRWAQKKAPKTPTTRKPKTRTRRTKKKVESDEEEEFDDKEETSSEGDEQDWEARDKKGSKKRKAKAKWDGDSKSDTPARRPSKRRKIAPEPRGPRGPSGLRQEVKASDIETDSEPEGFEGIGSDSDSDGYEGPKGDKKKTKAPPTRRSSRATQKNVSYNLDLDEDDFEDEMMTESEPKNAEPKDAEPFNDPAQVGDEAVQDVQKDAAADEEA